MLFAERLVATGLSQGNIKRLKWFVSTMRLLQTAFTSLARQGKANGVIWVSARQHSSHKLSLAHFHEQQKAPVAVGVPLPRGIDKFFPLLFYPSLGTKLSSCCPRLTHHSPFWWRNERNRHKEYFLFLLFAFSVHLGLICS